MWHRSVINLARKASHTGLTQTATRVTGLGVGLGSGLGAIHRRWFARELDKTESVLHLDDEEKRHIMLNIPQENIRNFSIIAHIDHGKSTLADRLLAFSGNISTDQRKSGQVLDKLEVERERGITVKAQTASIFYRFSDAPRMDLSRSYLLNLIDCPGHVDFSYEVSRSLSACQGALLLVDCSQGIQAQTLANFYIALENDLVIIPILSKIDLPQSDPERVIAEMVTAFDVKPEDILRCSAKTGAGIPELFPEIIRRIPPPMGRRTVRAPPGKTYFPGIVPSHSTTTSPIPDHVIRTAKENGGFFPKPVNGVAMTPFGPLKDQLGVTRAPLRGLIFDSWYDTHRGVVCLVKVEDGELRRGDILTTYHKEGGPYEVQDVGILTPDAVTHLNDQTLRTGQVGFVVANIKSTNEVRLGDTLISLPRASALALAPDYRDVETHTREQDAFLDQEVVSPASRAHATSVNDLKRLGASEAKRRLKEVHDLTEPLPGFLPAKSMVFAGLYPSSASDYAELASALEKLLLNDASVTVTKEHSAALGQGFRCGFLGMLHLDVFISRLEQEFGASVITTAPTVPYSAKMLDGTTRMIESPADFPSPDQVETYYEPMVKVSIITPQDYVGALTQLCGNCRGEMLEVRYLSMDRAMMRYLIPLAEVVIDFYQQIKSLSSGYASLDYDHAEDQPADIVKLDLRVNNESVDALSTICHRSKADGLSRRLLAKLKESIDRQNFEIVLQAAVGSKILARERIAPYRKDVLIKSGKLVGGGDLTRKKKLLEKQKEGKKRMKAVGNVEISDEAFLSVIKAHSRDS